MTETQFPSPDAFIARHLAALRDLGLCEAALVREEALLRGGFAARQAFAGLLDALHERK